MADTQTKEEKPYVTPKRFTTRYRLGGGFKSFFLDVFLIFFFIAVITKARGIWWTFFKYFIPIFYTFLICWEIHEKYFKGTPKMTKSNQTKKDQ
mmetsp:Transcript_54023/g.61846  ORF Transcript_54023/g.61846 Transcript_54023/m.61846 type:complete len:94 (-) Transcript_54023:202-483(-)